MATKALSFLGYTSPDRPYREATYCFEGEECTTPFMPEATARFFKPDELLVLVTKESRAQNFDDLAQRMNGLLPVQAVDIPSGKQEDELWEIFRIISEQIQAEDVIIFDITNGFRSLPVLSFLATSYIRVVRQATVSRMIYGAFDATEQGKTPVFDLTPFIRLLDWTTATDAFIKSGRGSELAKLIQQTAAQSTTSQATRSPLDAIAKKLGDFSAALYTVRPNEVMQTTYDLENQIEQVRSVQSPSIRPFSLLLDKIGEEYVKFGLEHVKARNNANNVIAKQFDMIVWYMDKNLIVQAMTLAREWLLSLIIVEAGGNMFEAQHRKDAENAFNEYNTQIDTRSIKNFVAKQQVWRKTAQLRNDLNHAGMRGRVRTSQEALRESNEVFRQLQNLMNQFQSSQR